jgi:DNA-binding MarR family transcriptional regulator
MKRPDTRSDELGPEEMAAWAPFVLAATQVVGALDTEMKRAFGIGHFDYVLLWELFRSDRRQARMSDLASMLRLAPSNITHRVRRLENRGLVIRRADGNDARVVLARLTPKGLHLLRDSRPMVQEGLRRHFLSHIDPKRLESMADIFSAIANAEDPVRRANVSGRAP